MITEDDRLLTAPNPPSYFNKWALSEWSVVWVFLSEYKLATMVDVSLVCAYCREMGLYHECCTELEKQGLVTSTPSGRKVTNPLVEVGNSALKNAERLANQFGFTPAARSRIQMKKVEKESDPFQDLLD